MSRGQVARNNRKVVQFATLEAYCFALRLVKPAKLDVEMDIYHGELISEADLSIRFEQPTAVEMTFCG
jgi:hypothetical protein